MTAQFVAFFILSVFAIGGAVFMINLTKVMHMAIALAFTFLSIAGIYFLLEAEFLAVIQILIYTGAITILMIFGIMLTKHNEEERGKTSMVAEVGKFSVVTVLFAILMWAIAQLSLPSVNPPKTDSSNVQALGEAVFTTYVIPFELTSVLLLVALVGAILLAKRESE
jgi:NADH-quinone oxidoreductase subunit J